MIAQLSMKNLTTARSQSTQSDLPGDPLFWKTILNQSDLFAYNSVNNGKGGPFGAQLWLFHSQKNQYILVGTQEKYEDSNAVLLKGFASAHAEAENLSIENRIHIYEFLKTHKNEAWKVIQISSGESCPSCRSKQILFANELIQNKLINKNDFYIFLKQAINRQNLFLILMMPPMIKPFERFTNLKY